MILYVSVAVDNVDMIPEELMYAQVLKFCCCPKTVVVSLLFGLVKDFVLKKM